MREHERLAQSLLDHVGRSNLRSPLFWWLYDHHDELLARAKGRLIFSKEFTDALAQAGIMDRTGKPATLKCIYQTWYRAKKLVSAERAAKIEAAPPQPQAQPVVASSPPAVSKPKNLSDEIDFSNMTPEGERRFRRLVAVVESRSDRRG